MLQITVVAAAALSTLAVTAPAQATTTASDTPTVNRTIGASKNTIAILAPYVKTTARGWELDAPASVLATVSPADVASIRQHMAATKVTDRKKWHGPHGTIENHWYGFSVYLDKYLTDKVTSGLTLPAIIATLITNLAAEGPAAAIITAAAAVMVVEIGVCKSTRGDVWLYIITLPPGLSVVCNPL